MDTVIQFGSVSCSLSMAELLRQEWFAGRISRSQSDSRLLQSGEETVKGRRGGGKGGREGEGG
jgi:hypothetical protein